MSNKNIVIDQSKISARVLELGEQITQDYLKGDLVLVGVLTGAFIFTADLVRAIDLSLEIDFIKVTSYGKNTSSSGSIELVQDISIPIEGRDVLVVEDIADTCNTLKWLKNHLAAKNPRSIRFCAMIDKKERREHDLKIQYSGFNVPNGFLVGYGLDHAGRYRGLPAVYELIDP